MKQLVCAATLSLTAALPLSAFAHSVPVNDHTFKQQDDVLYPKAKLNKNLGDGEYDFIGLHSKLGSTFNDEWKFTLAETSDVSISLSDVEVSLGNALQSLSNFGKNAFGHNQKSSQYSSSGALLDNKFLTFSLFDDQDHLLGTAGAGGSIDALGLLAGQWYTLTVSAKVNGIFGSAYRGSLDVTSPTAVPLGGTLPMFASALFLMTVRGKKRKSA